MESSASLKYNGPAVERGAMDVYEASANMIAFSEFVVEAAKATYGPDVQVRAEVSGFTRGSFETELVFQVVGATATIFSVVSPSAVWAVVQESIALWKHLKGSPPAQIVEKGQRVVVTNNNGDIIQVRAETLNVVFTEKAAQSAHKFIREALAPEGMDSIEIRSSGAEVATVSQSESQYFVSVSPTETVNEVQTTLVLSIEAPVFKDGNKWRFSDGQKSFYANIEDLSFLARVNGGERFGKGDQLRATVQIKQEKTAGKLTADYTIVKVLNHMLGKTQLEFSHGEEDEGK